MAPATPYHVVSAPHILAILGAAAQFAGFLIVLRELRRLNRQELGHTSKWQELKDIVIETINNPAPMALQVDVAESVLAFDGDLQVVPQVADPIQDLRNRVGQLEHQMKNAKDQVLSRADEIRAELDSKAAEIQNQFAALQEQRKSDVERAITNQRSGTILFLLGVTLTLASSLAS
jgi:hypothetical protein